MTNYIKPQVMIQNYAKAQIGYFSMNYDLTVLQLMKINYYPLTVRAITYQYFQFLAYFPHS